MRVCKHGFDGDVLLFARLSRKHEFEKVLVIKTRQVFFKYAFLRRLKLGKSLQTSCVNYFLLKLTF